MNPETPTPKETELISRLAPARAYARHPVMPTVRAQAISHLIITLRNEWGLTRAELAKRSGLCTATIRNWETKPYLAGRMRLIGLDSLAGVFGLTAIQFLARIDAYLSPRAVESRCARCGAFPWTRRHHTFCMPFVSTTVGEVASR
jgi:hypothetical protein